MPRKVRIHTGLFSDALGLRKGRLDIEMRRNKMLYRINIGLSPKMEYSYNDTLNWRAHALHEKVPQGYTVGVDAYGYQVNGYGQYSTLTSHPERPISNARASINKTLETNFV